MDSGDDAQAATHVWSRALDAAIVEDDSDAVYRLLDCDYSDAAAAAVAYAPEHVCGYSAPLFVAVANDNWPLLERLFREAPATRAAARAWTSAGDPRGRHVDPDAAEEVGSFPSLLFYAASAATARVLLRAAGLDPHARVPGHARTALHDAQSPAVARALVAEAGLDALARDCNGRTPLHRAQNAGVAAALLQCLHESDGIGGSGGGDGGGALLRAVAAADAWGWSPLHEHAAIGGDDDADAALTLRVLLEAVAAACGGTHTGEVAAAARRRVDPCARWAEAARASARALHAHRVDNLETNVEHGRQLLDAWLARREAAIDEDERVLQQTKAAAYA